MLISGGGAAAGQTESGTCDKDIRLVARIRLALLDWSDGVLPPAQISFDRLNAGQNVRLVVEDTVLLAHRDILAASCDFFAGLFNNQFAERSSGEVRIGEETAADMRLFLRFLYPFNTYSISEDNVDTLARLADKLLCATLRHLCVVFVNRNVTPANAVHLFYVSRAFLRSTSSQEQCIRAAAQLTWAEVKSNEYFARMSSEDKAPLMEGLLDRRAASLSRCNANETTSSSACVVASGRHRINAGNNGRNALKLGASHPVQPAFLTPLSTPETDRGGGGGPSGFSTEQHGNLSNLCQSSS